MDNYSDRLRRCMDRYRVMARTTARLVELKRRQEIGVMALDGTELHKYRVYKQRIDKEMEDAKRG